MPDADDGPDIYEECSFRDTGKRPSRVGHHPYEEHWEEIVESAGDSP